MYPLFMNPKKSPDPHRLILNLPDKINPKRINEYIALSNLSIYYTWQNIKRIYRNNKSKKSVYWWNDKFKLSDASYSA